MKPKDMKLRFIHSSEDGSTIAKNVSLASLVNGHTKVYSDDDVCLDLQKVLDEVVVVVENMPGINSFDLLLVGEFLMKNNASEKIVDIFNRIVECCKEENNGAERD